MIVSLFPVNAIWVNSYDQESHTAIYAKGVGYDWSTQMTVTGESETIIP